LNGPRNSTLQRIILQKSAEWTPKKSKKKLREDGTTNEEDATPGSTKIRKSSVKKSKLSKVVEGESDEHSDANILLLLSASKSPGMGAKIKMSKSPTKRASKISTRETVQQRTDSSCPPSSSSSPPKVKRLNKPYTGSVSNGLPSTLESGSMDRDAEVCLWSPGGIVTKRKMQITAGDIDYLSPRPGSKYACYDTVHASLLFSFVISVLHSTIRCAFMSFFMSLDFFICDIHGTGPFCRKYCL
jgi:hypothetical protein